MTKKHLNKKLFLIPVLLCAVLLAVFAVNYACARNQLSDRLKGRILLQVEQNGEAWYINPADSKRYFMGRPRDAFSLMQNVGIGITNENLNKIPIAEANMKGDDADGDGLSDAFEDAVGTDKNNTDTDNDGHNDKEEVIKGFNPTGSGKMAIDNNFAEKNKGKVFIQVESHGEAWYINPTDNKRYFLFRPIDAFNVMRALGLGITDKDLEKIEEDNASVKTCSEQSGNICSQSQSCSDSWIDASNTDRCCDGSCAAETISTGSTDEDSPFGIFGVFGTEYDQFKDDMEFDNDDYWEWAGDHFQSLGAKWSRQNTLLIWGLVEPEIGGGYDWQTKNNGEDVIENAYKYAGDDFNLVLVIDPGRNESRAKIINEEAFTDFVKTAVEKYGDKVKYWQAYNEPFPNGWKSNGGTADSYIEFLRLMSQTVKETDSEAKIILGAEISEGEKLSNGIKMIISELNGEKIFDVVDIHYWGYADEWKLGTAKEMRSYLDSHGYGDVEIWSMEHGTYANQPTKQSGESISNQTEKQQAESLIKRYVYNLANDVDKIFWNNLVEWSCFAGRCGGIFDNMGLISDGRNSGETMDTLGVPRLSYYTYKKMTEKLEGSDWDNIVKVKEDENGVYIYKFNNNGKDIWAAWNENSASQTISLNELGITGSAEITNAIPDADSGSEVSSYSTAFNIYTTSGEIELGDVPVFIKE